MSPQNILERRLFLRRPINIRVTFEDEFGDGLIYLYTEDIGLGGMFLTADIPIKVGSYVFLSFRLPDKKEEIRTTAQVARIARPADGKDGASKEGMGLRFVGLSPEAIKTIEDYVL